MLDHIPAFTAEGPITLKRSRSLREKPQPQKRRLAKVLITKIGMFLDCGLVRIDVH